MSYCYEFSTLKYNIFLDYFFLAKDAKTKHWTPEREAVLRILAGKADNQDSGAVKEGSVGVKTL